ncbi:MAG: hypothetical protein B6U68_00140 [Candidatus Aenigmarchaeota archaeon ex4484_14]|nr:MAG: hypothetical protein B6U68_00140 [Candidatus Aenigmarchaeota archaeon ex4484_14]
MKKYKGKKKIPDKIKPGFFAGLMIFNFLLMLCVVVAFVLYGINNNWFLSVSLAMVIVNSFFILISATEIRGIFLVFLAILLFFVNLVLRNLNISIFLVGILTIVFSSAIIFQERQ